VKTAPVFVALLLLGAASAQQNAEPNPHGVIFGIAIAHDGQPAKRIGLTATPSGVGLAAKLPHTRTNDGGEYRFDNVPWWGKYTVYADDEDAGYSDFSTGAGDDRSAPEVELTPDHPEAELTVFLPPKGGFVQIHLTNEKTGADISAMRVALMETESPIAPVLTMSCSSRQVILIPSDKSLLLHVWSDGFREWNESVGKGKLIHLASGSRLTLDVQLEPVQ
jgi:hypothetical protein